MKSALMTFMDEVCGGDVEGALELIDEFSSHFFDACCNVNALLAENTMLKKQQAAEQLHKIAGASGLMGLSALTETLRALETELRVMEHVRLDFCQRLNAVQQSFQNDVRLHSKLLTPNDTEIQQ